MSRREVELLAKGERLLESLKLKAEAARAAAEQAQLQLLIERAREGEPAPLKAWLDARDPAALAKSAPQNAAVVSSDRTETSEPAGWDSATGQALLAASRQRLGLELQASTSPSQEPAVQKSAAPKSKASRQVLAAVTNVLGDERLQPASQGKSRLAGVVASILAHVLLLVLLAVITLKLPADTAGLSLESASADAIEPVMEVVQEVETELPDAEEVSDAREPIIDASDSLSDIQANTSETLEQVSSSMPSSSATAAMSATAAASSGMPTGAAASFFGAAVGGNNFCYVIDASGSMRGGPWQAAKLELLKSLASLRPGQRYYIICFNRTLSPMALDGLEPESSSVYATPENLQKTRQWIETIEIGIGAPPNKALEYAIELEPDAIYLLSDGVTKVDVAEFLREINQVESLFGDTQIRVPIHPIAYYSLEGQTLLRQIAAENNGKFVYVPDPTK